MHASGAYDQALHGRGAQHQSGIRPVSLQEVVPHLPVQHRAASSDAGRHPRRVAFPVPSQPDLVRAWAGRGASPNDGDDGVHAICPRLAARAAARLAHEPLRSRAKRADEVYDDQDVGSASDAHHAVARLHVHERCGRVDLRPVVTRSLQEALASSLVVLFTYTTTRIGVFRWYARPPSYDKHVLESLRVNVSWLIPLQLVMKLAVVRSSRPVGDFFSVDAMLFCVTLLGWVKRRLI